MGLQPFPPLSSADRRPAQQRWDPTILGSLPGEPSGCGGGGGDATEKAVEKVWRGGGWGVGWLWIACGVFFGDAEKEIAVGDRCLREAGRVGLERRVYLIR